MNNQQHYPQGQSHEQYSRQQLPKPPKKPMSKEARIAWLILGGVVALLVGVAIGAGGSNATTTSSTPQPTVTKTVAGPAGATVTVTAPPVTKTVPGPKVTVTAPPPQAAAAITEDGVYLVGTDIKPGTYRNGAEDGCYWERLKNTSGDFDAIIANGNGGNQIVTIKRTDKAFSTQNCGPWRKVG